MKEWTPAEESSRLKERFANVENKARFARDHSVPGGPSMLNQHIHGHRPIGLDAALAYARGFGVPLAEISPRLARQVAQATKVAGAAPAGPEPKKPPSDFKDPEQDDSGFAQLAADWPYVPPEQRRRILDSIREPAAEARRHLQKMLAERLKGKGKA